MRFFIFILVWLWSVLAFANPILSGIQATVNCGETTCPQIEILVANDQHSGELTEKYILESTKQFSNVFFHVRNDVLDTAPPKFFTHSEAASQHIVDRMGEFYRQKRLDKSPYGDQASASPLMRIFNDGINLSTSKMAKKVGKSAYVFISQIPTKISDTYRSRNKEERTYILVKSAQSGYLGIIATSGLDAPFAAASVALLTSMYSGTAQLFNPYIVSSLNNNRLTRLAEKYKSIPLAKTSAVFASDVIWSVILPLVAFTAADIAAHQGLGFEPRELWDIVKPILYESAATVFWIRESGRILRSRAQQKGNSNIAGTDSTDVKKRAVVARIGAISSALAGIVFLSMNQGSGVHPIALGLSATEWSFIGIGGAGATLFYRAKIQKSFDWIKQQVFRSKYFLSRTLKKTCSNLRMAAKHIRSTTL